MLNAKEMFYKLLNESHDISEETIQLKINQMLENGECEPAPYKVAFEDEELADMLFNINVEPQEEEEEQPE
jgi:hypothetical protein